MPTIAATKPTTMYVTKRLVKNADTSLGLPLSLKDEARGMLGVLIVFESKEAAEMCHGIGVETFEIELVCLRP